MQDLSFEEYIKTDAVGSHALMDILKSPKYFYYKNILKKSTPDTDDLRFGRIAHAALLEPEKFKQNYIVKPKFDRRTTKGKQDFTEWEKGIKPEHYVIDHEELEILLGMLESVQAHPKAKNLLSRGKAETSWFWTDEETGVNLRIRPDFLIEEETGLYIVDLKTTRDVSPFAFQRSMVQYKYFLQAALYADGLELLTKKPVIFIFMAIEKSVPYEIGLYPADETIRETGRLAYRKALRLLKECRDKNEWPGMNPGFLNLAMPHWAIEEWGGQYE
jgi:exodeoxyribonuclease VIII